jgi:hypothetical protein
MGTRLSETELQKSLDFCVNLFSPTSPEQHERVANSGLSKYFLDVNAPVMDPDRLEGALDVADLEQVDGSGYDDGRLAIDHQAKVSGENGNGRVGLSRIANDAEDDEGKPAKLPPATKSYDRRMMRSDSDAQKLAETKMVVNKINARRVVHPEYAINNLESEDLNGFAVRLEKGKLGLTKVRSVAPTRG